MEGDIKNMRKIVKLILGVIFMLIAYNYISTTVYSSDTITKEIKSQSILNESQIQKEIIQDGKMYTYSDLKQLEIKPRKEIKSILGNEEKIVDNINKEYLKIEFDSIYKYEDEVYKGELDLIDFSIDTIDNGYSEKIDNQYINFDNLPTNDLEQIAKTRIINGREYVLINVKWIANKTSNIDKTTVPLSYNGIALYNSIIRTKNSDTFKVRPIYQGEVEEKEVLKDYILTYTEKEEPIVQEEKKIAPTVSILIAGGVIILGIIGIFVTPNATIYNTRKHGLIKIKSAKIKDKATITIDSTKNIKENNFILHINNLSYSRLQGKTVYIKLNSQVKTIKVTSQNVEFKF